MWLWVPLTWDNCGSLKDNRKKRSPTIAEHWRSGKRPSAYPTQKWQKRLRTWPTSCESSVATMRRSPWICGLARSAPSGVEPLLPSVVAYRYAERESTVADELAHERDGGPLRRHRGNCARLHVGHLWPG